MAFPAFAPKLPGGLQQTLNNATTIGTPQFEPFQYNTAPQPEWFAQQSQQMQASGAIFGNAATAAPANPAAVTGGVWAVAKAAEEAYSSALRQAGMSVFGGVPQQPDLSLASRFQEPGQVAQREQWAQEATAQGYDWRTDPRYAGQGTDYSAAPAGSLRERLEQQRQGRSQYGTLPERFAENPVEMAALLAAGLAAPTAVARAGATPVLGAGVKLLGGMMAGQLGSAGVQAIPGIEKLPDPIERGAILAPYFLGGPGNAVVKGGGVATSVLGGEVAESLGASRGVGEFVGGFAGAAPAALVRGSIGAVRNQIVSRKAGGILDTLAAATDEADLIARLKNLDPMDLMEVNEAVMRSNPELAKELGRALSAARAGDQQAAARLKGALYGEATTLSKRVAQMTGEAPDTVRRGAVKRVADTLGKLGGPTAGIKAADDADLSQVDYLTQKVAQAKETLKAQRDLRDANRAAGKINPNASQALDYAEKQAKTFGIQLAAARKKAGLPSLSQLQEEARAAADLAKNGPDVVVTPAMRAASKAGGSRATVPVSATPEAPVVSRPGVVQEPLGSVLSRSKELSTKNLRAIAQERGIDVPAGANKAAVVDAMKSNVTRQTFGTAADSIPPTPPKPPTTPALTPGQSARIDHFTDMTRGVIENESRMQKVYEAARPLTTAFSGDVRNSKIAELIAREAELLSVLQRSGMAEDVAKETAKNWRNQGLNRYFQGDELTAAKEEFSEFARKVSTNTPVDAIADTWKATTLNADFSVLGQQVEASAHRGIIPVVMGSANAIARKLGVPGAAQVYLRNDIDRVSQAVADGLVPFGRQAADINAPTSLFGKVPGVGRKAEGALNALADFQYGTVLGSIRLRAYEGLLLQNKIIHKLSLGKLGGDITDPLVRRHIAEFANTIGSTARGATGGLRASTERRLLLSPRMTRAQVNEVLTPLFSMRSQEDAINTANLLGSYVLTLGAGKALADMVGAPGFNFEYSPIDAKTGGVNFNFGKVTTDFADSKGRKRVIDFMPQDALSTAIYRSIGALSEGDGRKLQEAWQKYGVGRLNFIPGSGLALTGGVGYGADGKFYPAFSESGIGGTARTMPLEDRLQKLNPTPLTFRQMGLDPATAVGAESRGDLSVAGVAAGLTGQGMYPESSFGARDRYSSEKYDGRTFDEINALGQSIIIAQMAKDGVPFESNALRATALNNAPNLAWEGVVKTYPALAEYGSYEAYREALREEGLARGLSSDEVTKRIDKAVDAWVIQTPNGPMSWADLRRHMQKQVVKYDPDVVDFASNLSNEVKEYAETLR